MATCPACASPLAEGSTVCSLCGFSLSTSVTAAEAGPPRAPTRPAAPRPPGPRAPTGAQLTGAATRAATSAGPAPSPASAGGDVDPYLNRTIAGKFQVIELLGQGGMGKVYKARHLGLDKTVCIKTLKPQLLEDATVVGRFEREAKASSRLNHGNSIQVLDFGQDELGALYIVMEYVSGKDLRKTLRDEFPLGEERICHIMAQVLSALAEAHAQNVIHRDLKPENIMLEQRRGEPDYVKVLDFGIAKIQDPDVPGLTRADVVCGTPLYMSPEQATGSQFDARADLYSIGVILYQLTTGTLPFDGGNSMEILTRHVTELPIPPRTRRPEVAISEEMEALTLRALEKLPENRPQTAEAFRAELLKIGEMLRRRREEAAAAATAASTAHKQAQAQAIKQKQEAQRAAFRGEAAADSAVALALPKKSRAPLFAGLGVGVLVLAVGGFFLTRGGEPAPVVSPSPTAPAAPSTPSAIAPTEPPVKAAVAAPEPASAEPAPPTTAPSPPAVKSPVVKTPPKEATRRTVDPKQAEALVDEGDLLTEEEDYRAAIRAYRNAISADPGSSKAYKGLIRAGTGAGDSSATRAGIVGYLKVAPDAPDAASFRRMLDAMK